MIEFDILAEIYLKNEDFSKQTQQLPNVQIARSILMWRSNEIIEFREMCCNCETSLDQSKSIQLDVLGSARDGRRIDYWSFGNV